MNSECVFKVMGLLIGGIHVGIMANEKLDSMSVAVHGSVMQRRFRMLVLSGEIVSTHSSTMCAAAHHDPPIHIGATFHHNRKNFNVYFHIRLSRNMSHDVMKRRVQARV